MNSIIQNLPKYIIIECQQQYSFLDNSNISLSEFSKQEIIRQAISCFDLGYESIKHDIMTRFSPNLVPEKLDESQIHELRIIFSNIVASFYFSFYELKLFCINPQTQTLFFPYYLDNVTRQGCGLVLDLTFKT
jgi:hypothetical protein